MAISCKGRNGWFNYGENHVGGSKSHAMVQIFSRRPTSNMAPVVIEGPKAEVKALLQELLKKVGEV